MITDIAYVLSSGHSDRMTSHGPDGDHWPATVAAHRRDGERPVASVAWVAIDARRSSGLQRSSTTTTA
jgi:hypothetical protein